MRPSLLLIAATLLLSACFGGGDSGGDDDNVAGGAVPAVAIEETSPDYPDISDRAAMAGPTTVTIVLLEDGVPQLSGTSGFDQATGAMTGGLLDGTDIDDTAFTNPADSEYARIFNISGATNLFGVVGFVTDADIPPDGTVTNYNRGNAELVAAFVGDTYVLSGNATMTATWADNRISGQFTDLSGTVSSSLSGVEQPVNDVGDISLTDSIISGSTFSGGAVSGTGIFAPLDGDSLTIGTQGAFFGPEADEVGGVLVIDDNDNDIDIIGAFQAD